MTLINKQREIFVFGSNLSGFHGAGSARAALDNHGAEYGNGDGLQGNSYAIPTKDHKLRQMRFSEIRPYVDKFIQFAKSHPEMTFRIVAIGCGLAKFTPTQMAPMFRDCPSNCVLPPEFLEVLK